MLLRRFILTLYFIPVFGGRGRGGYGGQRVSYPSGNGLSGTSNHRGAGYPPGGGQSGTNSYQRAAGYPPSTGLSGVSGAGAGRPSYRTEVHHHYHYAPPQHISYGAAQHPVYHGTPPVYVYEYRNSGSRFDTLLTGLALYNLGRMSAHRDSYSRYGSEYRGSPGEMCKLAISRRNGEYEETRVDCRLMSSFIWDADRESAVSTRTVVSHTVTSNGTTTTVQNTTVVDALQAKGPSIQVTPGMDCFMIRISRDTSKLKRRVDCALLQEYALRSYNKCDTLRFLPLLLLFCFVFLCS